MRAARVLAQAKINLLLLVGERRPDGYHDLVTQFQRIDLADDVTVRLSPRTGERSLDCDGPALPADGLGPMERNLAYRAALAYCERAGIAAGFAIEIVKNIPVGGGLGGGSADAGAVLRILDTLSSTPLGSNALARLARSLGADVPFLSAEWASAFAAGVGDLFVGLDALPARDVLLAVPTFAVATSDAYRWLDEHGGGSLEALFAEARTAAPPGYDVWRDGARDWDEARSKSQNDFEPVLEVRYPALRRLREALAAQGADIARLSGSGSTVFGVFAGPAPAVQDLAPDTLVIPTRTSSRVVQVEVLE